MSLYHKMIKPTIFFLMAFSVLLLKHTVSATPVNGVSPYPTTSSPVFGVQYSVDTRFIAETTTLDEETSSYISTFNVPINLTLYKNNYSSWLYLNGNTGFSISFNVSFNKPILSSSVDYTYTTSCNPVSSIGVLYENRFNRPGSISSSFGAYFDNLYCESTSTSIMNFIVNYRFTVVHTSHDASQDFYLGLNDFTINHGNFGIFTSVQPSAVHGLAFTISESVSRAIYNSTIEEDLDGIHTDIEATNLILSQIKQQDLSLYNQIISTIVSQTQNDNALQQAFLTFLTNQLHGSATYGLDSNMSLHIEGPIGEMVSHIWYQVIDFKTKFQQFVAANQSEAAEVNSEAASQESALSDLQESLVVPTPAVDGVLNDLASDIADSGISSGQGDVFFFLRVPYIVRILAFVFSLGLAGFILYGKG